MTHDVARYAQRLGADGLQLIVHVEGGGNGGNSSRGVGHVGGDRAWAVRDALERLINLDLLRWELSPSRVLYETT